MKRFLLFLFFHKRHLLLLILLIFIDSNGLAQEMIKGPYLIEPGENQCVIRWEVDRQSSCFVKFGLENSLKLIKKADLRGLKNGGYLYEAVLKGLKPASTYYYQVLVDQAGSEIKNFKTCAKNQQNMRFVAMGDSRSNPDIFQKIIHHVYSDDPDFIISMGDLVENGGAYQQWQDHYFFVAGDLIDHIPLVSTLGDHEGDGDDGELFRHFLRTDQQTDKQWFSFEFGTALFISLDYRHPESKEMIQWFRDKMETSSAKWRLVFMHRPCYNLGGHRTTWGRDIWPDLFREYGVDIVFAGHSHQYERFYPLRPDDAPESHPVTYITTGGAGADLYEVVQHPFLACAESVHHFLFLEIVQDTLWSTAYRNDGTVLDRFQMIKSGKKYHRSYLDTVTSQEDVDIYTMFARGISFSLNQLPLYEFPARIFLEFIQSKGKQKIPFEIKLHPESIAVYSIKPINGLLNQEGILKVPIDIFREKSVMVSEWGELDPELRLVLKYQTQKTVETIIGAAAEYWPESEY